MSLRLLLMYGFLLFHHLPYDRLLQLTAILLLWTPGLNSVRSSALGAGEKRQRLVHSLLGELNGRDQERSS